MATISDIVKIKTGYANFVELKSSFEQDQENLERMAMYRPTKAHRQAFERLCRGLYSPTDKKFYLLSGSYGTGKSHLCLMFANFLSRSSGDPEVAGFYDNYEKLDPEQGKMLRNLRKDGQYLVAICDYNTGRNFEDVVLRAVIEACESKGIRSLIHTRHDEAERLLADWEAQSGDGDSVRDFYKDFSRALEKVAPMVSVEQLREGLRGYDSDMLATFMEAYREAQGGTEFQPRAGNIIPIIRELVKSREFKDRFKGLAILFDEFGFTLEKAAYSKDILQGFMEKLCQNEPNILFVGCIHKDFTAYADRFSKDDAKVMAARITHVNLLNEGIEEIIGAIVETDKDSPVWKSEVEPKLGILDNLLPMCETLRLFPWIKDSGRIRQRVLEDIYGVHPVALACLLRLSAEIGSDARSTFTFFTGDVAGAKGSYAEFIPGAEITVNGGKLNLYTVAGLFDFFSKELNPKNAELRDRQRELVNGYGTSEFAFRKAQQAAGEPFATDSDPRVLILKIILLYQLCKIPTTEENILFGLYGLKAEQKIYARQLKKLTKMGAIFFRKQSKTYELAAAGGEDPYDLIDRWLEDTSKHPDDLVQALLEEGTDKKERHFLEARQYNLTYNEDKRLRREFVRARDLGPEFLQRLLEKQQDDATNCLASYEGIAVYALCEDEADIRVAREAVNSIPDKRIVVAVPHAPQPFSEQLLKVKACRHYLQPAEAEKLNSQTESRLRDLFGHAEDGLLPGLKRIMAEILGGESACWYGEKGRVVVDGPPQSHKPADLLCEELFTRRCRIKHPDLNLVHDGKWKKGKNTALKQAVNMLLKGDVIQIDNGNPSNHGEKKYLENVLLKRAGALKKTGSEGTVTFFQCESRPEKISDDFPVLKELCQRLAGLAAGEYFAVGPFIREMKEAPWGVSETALMLAMAHVVAAFGERLRIYKDSTRMVDEQLGDYARLEQLLVNPLPKLVFEIQEISPVQEELIEKIALAVHAPPLLHGEKRSMAEACEQIKSWWHGLPRVAKNKDIYDQETGKRIAHIKEQFDKLSELDRSTLLFETIPGLYGEPPVKATDGTDKTERIASAFARDVQLLEAGEDRAESLLAAALGQVFAVQGDLEACEKVIQEWFEGLNPDQRDATRYETSPDVQGFVWQLAQPNIPFKTKLLEKIPEIFHLEPVRNWNRLRIDDFVAKLKQVKEEIEAAAVIIPMPEVLPREKVVKGYDGNWEVEEGGSLELALPAEAAGLVYTVDGSDPRGSQAARKSGTSVVLQKEFTDKSMVRIMARCFDDSGNYSDLLSFAVINKQKEYQVEVIPDNLFHRKGTFKIPDNTAALKRVLHSMLDQAVSDKIISDSQAETIRRAVDTL